MFSVNLGGALAHTHYVNQIETPKNMNLSVNSHRWDSVHLLLLRTNSTIFYKYLIKWHHLHLKRIFNKIPTQCCRWTNAELYFFGHAKYWMRLMNADRRKNYSKKKKHDVDILVRNSCVVVAHKWSIVKIHFSNWQSIENEPHFTSFQLLDKSVKR